MRGYAPPWCGGFPQHPGRVHDALMDEVRDGLNNAIVLVILLAVAVGTMLTILRWTLVKAHAGGAAQAIGG